MIDWGREAETEAEEEEDGVECRSAVLEGGSDDLHHLPLCANLVRNCLKEPSKFESLSRLKVHFVVSNWVDGKPQKPSKRSIKPRGQQKTLLPIGRWEFFMHIQDQTRVRVTEMASSILVDLY